MNVTLKRRLFWVVLIVAGISVWTLSTTLQTHEPPVAFSDFLADVKSDKIEAVTIVGNEITGIDRIDKKPFWTVAPSQYKRLANTLIEHGILVSAEEPTQNPWASLLYAGAPILLLVSFGIFFLRQMQSGGTMVGAFGRSRAKRSSRAQKTVTFLDVLGRKSVSRNRPNYSIIFGPRHT